MMDRERLTPLQQRYAAEQQRRFEDRWIAEHNADLEMWQQGIRW